MNCCAVSSQGSWIFGVGEDFVLYSFNVDSGKLEAATKIHEKEVIVITSHPHSNTIATCGTDGYLKIWKP